MGLAGFNRMRKQQEELKNKNEEKAIKQPKTPKAKKEGE